MTDEKRPNDENDDSQTEDEFEEDIEEETPIRQRRFRFSFFWTAVIVILIVIIVLGLAWHTGRKKNGEVINKSVATLQQTNSQTQTQLSALKQQLTNLQQQVSTIEAKNTQQSKDIEIAQATSARLQDELLGKQSGWLADEALYLAHLAKYTLEFQHNISSSILLLQDADHALFRTGSPNVNDARRILANDIAELQGLPKVDTDGIYLRLQALNTQIDKLPVLAQNPAGNKVDTKNKEHKDWKDAIKNNLHSIGKLIVIQRRDKPIMPLLTPEQYGLLNQYIALLFGHAEWALLQHSQKVYQASLSQIANTIEMYYATSSDATKAMLKNLSELQKINIAPKTPDLSNAVNALTALAEKNSTNTSSNNNKGKTA